MTQTRRDRPVDLVGRHDELATLLELHRQATSGQGQVALVTGPAGIGKTRLLTEVTGRVRREGTLVLRGLAVPLQQDIPYAPVMEALRPLLASSGGSPLLTPAGGPSADHGRIGFFESVWRLLQRAANGRPVLLVIEDLHCADSSTLALLHYVARGLDGQRLMVLATFRTDELTEDLRALRSGLRAVDVLTELRLDPLSRAEVASMIDGQLDRPAPAGLVELVEQRARGVPLFVRSLVATMADADRAAWAGPPDGNGHLPLPSDLVELVGGVLDRLAPAERAVVDLIAVAGDAASLRVLRSVVPEPDPESVVRRLVSAGTVIEDPVGPVVLLRTHHPLLAEVAYQRLLLSTRQRLHAATARALASSGGSDPGLLAAQLVRAGAEVSPEETLDACRAALRHALDRGAGAEAMRWAEQAGEIAARLGRSDTVRELTERVGDAAALAEQPQRAVTTWTRLALTAPRPVRVRLLRKVATLEGRLGRLTEAQRHLEEAGSLVDPSTDPDEALRIALASLMTATRGSTRASVLVALDRAQQLAAQVVSADRPSLRRLAEDLADESLRRIATGDVLDAPLTWGAALDPELGRWMSVAAVHKIAIVVALVHGDTDEALRRAGAAAAHAGGLGSADELTPWTLAGWAHLLAGRWDEAARIAAEVHGLAHRAGLRREEVGPLVLHAAIRLRRGDAAAARQTLSEAVDRLDPRDRHLSGLVGAAEMMLALDAGDAERAGAALQAFSLDSYLPVLSVQLIAEYHLATGDPAEAQDAVAVLDRPEIVSVWARAVRHRINGLVARQRGDRATAAALLSAAVDDYASVGFPYEHAVTGLELAELTGDLEGLRVSIDRLSALGAERQADRARRLHRSLAGGRSPRRPAIRREDGLTSREYEIASLVGEGLSNAEVAERLFISPRTVTTHLARIYSRLGLESRTALVRYVLRHPSNT